MSEVVEALFERATIKVKARCSELDDALQRDHATISHIALRATFAWLEAHSLCREMFSIESMNRSTAAAARSILESQCRILIEQFVTTSKATESQPVRLDLQRLGALLIRMSRSPFAIGERVADR